MGQGCVRRGKGGLPWQMARVRNTKQYRWSAVGRDAFDNAQRQGNRTDEHPNYGQRYEPGEGGGVT